MHSCCVEIMTFSPFTDIIYGIIAGAGGVDPKLVP
jgi:hypothetical protein